MNIAIICSNFLRIDQDVKKGTEIIAHTFIRELAHDADAHDLRITAFASGDSDLPVKIESVDHRPSSANIRLIRDGKHGLFELALLSKAFSLQDSFDLYHIHIGDGDIALPFVPFVHKPILITLYHPTAIEYGAQYFSLFKDNKNVFFVSPTERQRKRIPSLSYIATIPHGIDAERDFTFHPQGGNDIMWAGRGIPQKGADTAIEIAGRTGKSIHLFAMPKSAHAQWFDEEVVKKIERAPYASLILDKNRLDLAPHFQMSKLFLFPLRWEEPFGLVIIESMACGTPVIAYARGAIPELVKDGETGFLVNPSEDDIRGDWIIKKTGTQGLCEAVERIYAMSEEEYHAMRRACRARVEKRFTVARMAQEYIALYKRLAKS